MLRALPMSEMMVVELASSLRGRVAKLVVTPDLAYIAGLAYGDGYPEWGEIRIVTMSLRFKEILVDLTRTLAELHQANLQKLQQTWKYFREYAAHHRTEFNFD